VRVHELKKGGQAFAFEMSSVLGRDATEAILRRMPGILPSPLYQEQVKEADEFFTFSLNNVEFYLFEPFGDSSRYWLGSRDLLPHPELELISAYIRKLGYREILRTPSAFVRVLLISLFVAIAAFGIMVNMLNPKACHAQSHSTNSGDAHAVVGGSSSSC